MPTYPARSLGMAFITIAFLVTVAGCCKPFKAWDPLRVLQAKSNFGKMTRGCGVELTKMMKELPNEDFQKRMAATCQVYNECRSSLDENSSQEMFNCLWKESQENGVQWTIFPSPPGIRHATRNLMVCLNRTLIQNLPLEKLDDTAAYTRQFLLRYG